MDRNPHVIFPYTQNTLNAELDIQMEEHIYFFNPEYQDAFLKYLNEHNVSGKGYSVVMGPSNDQSVLKMVLPYLMDLRFALCKR